jgi:protein TonB
MMSSFYPDHALRNGIGGRTQLSCIVGAGGILADCTILSESPVGMGFGDATLKLAKQFRAPTVARDGQSMVGRPFVRNVVWQVPPSQGHS